MAEPAENEKKAEEPKKEGGEAPAAAPAPAQAPAAAETPAAPPAKMGKMFFIGLGGGAMAVMALAYFMAAAAVQTGQAAYASEIAEANGEGEVKEETTPAGGEEKEGAESKGEHGEEAKSEHGEGGQGESSGQSEGEHGEASQGEGHGGGEAKPTDNPNKAYAAFEELTICLRNSGMKRLLRTKIGMLAEGNNAKDVVLQATGDDLTKARVLDALNTLLRNKELADLDGDANVKLLKREIANAITKVAFPKDGSVKISEILLVEFLVQ